MCFSAVLLKDAVLAMKTGTITDLQVHSLPLNKRVEERTAPT